MKKAIWTSALTVLAICVATNAQTMAGSFDSPIIDRWDYPFASQPGTEQSVPVFAALRQSGFDDRDGLFLLTFDSSSSVPPGLGDARYVVRRVSVTVWVSVDYRFEYDPTFDSVVTSYDPADPDYRPDSDAGKPVELFGAAYRNGWSATSYAESSPFSPFAPFPPREGVRNVYVATFDTAGVPTDIGRQVRQKFEATPMAIGRNDTLTPGQLVPAGTPFVFEVNLNDPATHAYWARAFNSGRLPLIISGLHAASGGPGGGTGEPAYPAFFTKENATAQVAGYIPSMSVDVTVYPGADFNLDGGVDGADVEAFFLAWQAGADEADFNLDGGVDGADVEAFFIAWQNG